VDAFERVVVSLLEREGFWVRSSFKVELTKEEKVRIGRPSSPRWELDLIGYRARDNELRIVECKSYLDSRGVAMSALNGASATWPDSPEDTVQYGRMLHGTWRWLGTGRDSVVVRFTNGFSGATLVLGVDRAAGGAIELRGGRARPFSDVLTPGGAAESRATVRREPCPSRVSTR